MATTSITGSSKHPPDTKEHPPLGAKLLPCRLEEAHKGIPRSPIASMKAPTSNLELEIAPRLLPCRFEEVWRASARRLDWIALAGGGHVSGGRAPSITQRRHLIVFRFRLTRLWIQNARANFEMLFR